MAAPVPLETKREFLAILAETGNVLETCRRTGVNRATAYHWRGEPDFARMWEDALLIRREAIRDELVEKAMAATGHLVEERVIGEDGQPALDDDFEPLIVRRLVGHDSNVLRTLLNKFIRSEDGAPVTAVQVNNHVHAGPRSAPKLVQPEIEASFDADFDEAIDVDA